MADNDNQHSRAYAMALCDRLEGYHFECEAGPLKNCVEWRELRELVINLTQQLIDANQQS